MARIPIDQLPQITDVSDDDQLIVNDTSANVAKWASFLTIATAVSDKIGQTLTSLLGDKSIVGSLTISNDLTVRGNTEVDGTFTGSIPQASLPTIPTSKGGVPSGGASHIADASANSNKLIDGSVTGEKIDDNTIELDKISTTESSLVTVTVTNPLQFTKSTLAFSNTGEIFWMHVEPNSPRAIIPLVPLSRSKLEALPSVGLLT